MAIKDQCDSCVRKGQNGMFCFFNQIKPAYDGVDCNDYIQNIPEQSEAESQTLSEGVNPSMSPEKGKIGGWLGVFLITVIGGGAILSIVLSALNFSFADYDLGQGALMATLGYMVGVVELLTIPVFAAYVLYSFIKRNANAVAVGKVYLIYIFFTNVIALFWGDIEDSGLGSYKQIVQALISGVIWFSFLCTSVQVNELFPKKRRVVMKRDKILFTVVFGVPIIWIVSVFSLSWFHNSKVGSANASIIEESVLKDGEYTDGRVIIVQPANFELQRKTENDLVFYSVTGENEWGAFISTIDENQSFDHFMENVESWRPDSYADFEYGEPAIQDTLISGFRFISASYAYNTEPAIVWELAALYDSNSDKVCYITLSYKTEGAAAGREPLKELAGAVRFQ